jgi:hypothetical protein
MKGKHRETGLDVLDEIFELFNLGEVDCGD